MAVRPPPIRLTAGDLPDLPNADKLLAPIVSFASSVGTSLVHSLTLGDNVEMKAIAFQPPTPWLSFSFAASWGAYPGGAFEAPAYRKDGELVRLKGLLRYTGGGSAPLTIATLPQAYWPAETSVTSTPAGVGTFARVDVDTSGNVVLRQGVATDYVSLSGISFPAAYPRPLDLSPYPIRVGISSKTKPSHVFVSVVETGNTTAATPAVASPSWTYDGAGSVLVHAIPGLTPGTNYTLTFLIIAAQ